jgi:hypothetical protein
VQLTAGGSASATLVIERSGLDGMVSLEVRSNLPPGADARISDASISAALSDPARMNGDGKPYADHRYRCQRDAGRLHGEHRWRMERPCRARQLWCDDIACACGTDDHDFARAEQRDLQQGTAALVAVAINRTGDVGDVALSTTPQVQGVTASFAPNPATAGTSTLTLQVADDATPGEHTLTVTGTACSLTSSAAVTVRIIDRPDPRAPIVLEDDFEGTDRWTETARRYRRTEDGINLPEDNPWVHAIASEPTGGNPTGYRRMTHTLTAQTAPDFTSIFVEHAFTNVDGVVYEYDPRVDGAITSLDYAEDRIVAQFATYGTLFVRQSGIVYVLTGSIDPGTAQFTNTTWERFTVTGLTANSFQAAPGFAPATPPRPDFSATGAPLQFGFVRGTSARFPITVGHGIDNWRLTIHR